MPDEAGTPAIPAEPPPIPPPKGFTLPLSAWLAWIICAGLLTLHSCSYVKNPSPFEQGQLIGRAIGILILPTLVAWILWRVAGRSTIAGRVGFFGMLLLVVAGQIPQSLERAKKHSTADKLQALARETNAEMRAALDKEGGLTAEASGRIFDKASQAFAAEAASSRGENREIALAMQAYLARGNAVQQSQVAAVDAVDFDTFFDLDSLATANSRTSRRAALQQLKEANARLREFLEGGSTWLEAELTRRKVSPGEIRQAMAGYASSANRKMPMALAIRTTDEELVGLMENFISFAEEHEGRWSRNPANGNLTLPTDAAVEKYNALMKQVKEVGEKQVELQKRLLSASPAAD